MMQSRERKIRQRFDREFLPKYGSLWSCIEQTRAPCADFVTAIEKKARVTIHGGAKQLCNCQFEPQSSEKCESKEDAHSIPTGATQEIETAKTERQVIHLLEDDSDEGLEFDIQNSVDTTIVIEVSSDSDKDSIRVTRPTESSKQQSIRTPSSFTDDESSDSSGDNEFEMSFSDHSDEESGSVDDLIESTKRLCVNEKENIRRLNQPTRKRAKMSKYAFKIKRESMTKELFDEFNLKAFDGRLDSVNVQWSAKLRTTAGLTRLRRSSENMTPGIPQRRFATIELSKKVLHCQGRLECTLLHEMVHAAAWIFDNQCKPPHGEYFWKWARIAMKKIPGIEVTTTHSYEIEYKYAWACSTPDCSFLVKRQSRSVDVNRHCCGRCKGRLVEVDAKTANTNRKEKRRPAPSGYNLFVKEQSKRIREKLMATQRAEGQLKPKVSQSEVMKECARLWREKKAVLQNR